jgi:hypothetical protein
MNQDSTKDGQDSTLVGALLALVKAHRSAFRQERVYRRVVAMVLAELFVFARHTVTQSLWALGMTGGDWSAWYRLFSRPRFEEIELAHYLLQATLQELAPTAPYVVGTDATQIPRSSQKMPGTSWLRALRTAVFRRGLHRAQRFLHGAWLPPSEQGYTRAIPLRFLPAFPAKAVAAEVAPRQEWAASLVFVKWVRTELDRAGRIAQQLVVLADGAYDTVGFWRDVPQRTIAIVRSARNRHLREMPPPYPGHGRRRKYGEVAPKPADWLALRQGWHTCLVSVRGRYIKHRYQIHGPYLRERAAAHPLFLLVVGGASWKAGKREPKRVKRLPSFYLISAILVEGTWQLPFSPAEILAWIWQRWELEVAHREMKSGFGVGEKQCWTPRSAVLSVQWSVWVYAILLLAGYRSWGWLGGPPTPTRWWPGARRWSLNTLWRSYRAELWGQPHFRPLFPPTTNDWPLTEHALAALTQAVSGAARA